MAKESVRDVQVSSDLTIEEQAEVQELLTEFSDVLLMSLGQQILWSMKSF